MSIGTDFYGLPAYDPAAVERARQNRRRAVEELWEDGDFWYTRDTLVQLYFFWKTRENSDISYSSWITGIHGKNIMFSPVLNLHRIRFKDPEERMLHALTYSDIPTVKRSEAYTHVL